MIKRKLSLSENITAFCQYLRSHRFTISPTEEADALLALSLSQVLSRPEGMCLCLQTILCKTPKQIQVFQDLYRTYWKELDRAVDHKIKDEAAEDNKASKTGQQRPPSLTELKNWLFQGKTEEEGSIATYSATSGRDPLHAEAFDEAGVAALQKIIRLLLRRLTRQKSRRYRPSKASKTTDLRNTFRQSLKYGFDIFPIQFKSRKPTELNISVICDISRSMELYSRFLLQFTYAFRKEYTKIASFAFNTELHHLTPLLENDSLEKVVQGIKQKNIAWGGGTRIGHSLDQFRKKYGHKCLKGKSMVIILSDGWDTGDIELLRFNMRFLQRKSHQLIWINPLAGKPGWKPEVRGMETAMPYIDFFVPAHHADALKVCFSNLKAMKRKRYS